MAAQLSDGEKLELVFLKLGLAETDEELQAIVNKFLTPILPMVASEDGAVRAKVLELLAHLNKRLKARECVQVPVASLFKQINDESVASFAKNFTITYIQTGFPRLPSDERIQLFSTFLTSLKNKPSSQQDVLLRLLVESFPLIDMENAPSDLKNIFSMESEISRLVIDFCFDYLLLPYSWSDGNISPPGLSLSALKRLAGGATTLESSAVEQVKISIIKLIKSDVLAGDGIVCHLVVASADTKHSVASIADVLLRRHVSDANWAKVDAKLFQVYVGDVTMATKKTPRDPSTLRQPANIRIKLKITTILTRSDTAALRFPQTIQLIYDGLFGKTNAKLQLLTIQFAHSVIDKCSDSSIMRKQSALILDALLKTASNPDVAGSCRGLAYVGVSKLSSKAPDVLQQRIALVQSMVDDLAKEEDSQLKSSIREALMMLSQVLRGMPSFHPQLQIIVRQCISSADQSLQMVGVHYASTIFPSNDVPSRYQLLLAISQGTETTAMHANKALFAGESNDSNNSSNTTLLPSFVDMTEYAFTKATERLSRNEVFSIGGRIMAYPSSTFLALISYLRRCMTGGDEDEDNELSRIRSLTTDKNVLMIIRKYVDLCFQLSTVVSDATVMSYLLEVVASCPDDVTAEVLFLSPSSDTANSTSSRLKWLKDQTSHTNEKIRGHAAELYAIAVWRNIASTQRYSQLVPDVMRDAKSKIHELKHGSVVLLGFLISDWLRLQCNEAESINRRVVTSEAISLLLAMIADPKNVSFCSAACTSIGEISRKAELPVPDDAATSPASKDDLSDSSSNKKPATKLEVTRVMLSLLSSKTPHKLREVAVTSVGRLPVGDEKFPHTQLVLEEILKTSEVKDVEFHFSVGAALCSASLGTRSPERFSKWQERGSDEYIATESDKVPWLVDKILTDYVNHRVPSVRQASCIWMMVMLKTSSFSKHPHLQERLMDLQNAFQSMLAESDDLTQDIASKGFGLVYDLAGPDLKKVLVNQLVESLAGSSSSPASKVRIIGQEGSGLFRGGSVQLGKAPDGSNVTTYKELCSLASELNQPDLIYKFLHLANHHLYWNTKKGVAFGFRSIALAARDEMRPHLPRIVPRLYRYTFDPQPSVRSAMTSIWNVLDDDPNKLVAEFLEPIVDDLLRCVTDKIWRTRQASCRALAKLLQGGFIHGNSPTNPLITKLPELWHNLLRVRDDIKETVRDAAQDTCLQLKKVTIRLFDGTNSETSTNNNLSDILAVLLSDGLNSSVAEVRALSLSTLVEISKRAGGMIKPCIAQIVGRLLEALSGTEAQVINYVHTRSSGVTQDALDSVRIQSVRGNPLMETAVRCLNQCDATILKDVVTVLVDVTKRGVGLITKAGCCFAIQALVPACGDDLTPHTGKIISALTSGVQDRSVALRRVYSDTIGVVVSVASDASVEKTLLKMKQWYLDKEDINAKQAATSVIYALAKKSPDVLTKHATLVLPLAFFGMHEPKNKDAADDVVEVCDMWKEVWEEFTPGLESALRLYMGEITELCSSCLGSAKWLTKAQAAAALSRMVKKQHSPSVVSPHLSSILQVLLDGSRGRTWEGKHHLLEALSDVTVHCDVNTEQVSLVVSSLERECQRGKMRYRRVAMTSLADVLQAHTLDAFERFWKLVSPILLKNESSTSSSEDDDEKSTNGAWETKESYLKSLSRVWSVASEASQVEYFDKVFTMLARHALLSTHAMQLTSLKCISSMLKCVDARHMRDDAIKSVVYEVLLPPLCTALGDIKFATTREEGLSAVKSLMDFTLSEDSYASKKQALLPLVEALSSSPLHKSTSPHYEVTVDLLKRISLLDEAMSVEEC